MYRIILNNIYVRVCIPVVDKVFVVCEFCLFMCVSVRVAIHVDSIRVDPVVP
jgi:hypothetical protein